MSLCLKIVDFSPEYNKARDCGLQEMTKKAFSEIIFLCNHAKLVRNSKTTEILKISSMLWKRNTFSFSDIALVSQIKKSPTFIISTQKLVNQNL